MLRVVHAPIEISGQMGLICQSLKRKGIQALGYNTFQTSFKYGRGVVETDAFELTKLFESLLRHFDLYHFHNSYTLLQDYLDLPILQANGKKIIMHHRGNDVRFAERAHAKNPYVNTESSFPDEVIDRNLRLFSKYVSAAIVQDYELYDYVKDYYPKVHVLPRLIDVSQIQTSFPNLDQKVPLIVHAPTDRLFKGTDVIEATLQDLKKKYSFDFILVENMSHREAMRCYRAADLVIDQVRCGMFGNLSVEAMAIGKPVMAYIREDLRDTFPEEIPIISANPDTLRTQLIDLIQNADLRRHLGVKGRQYVKKYHHADVVIEQLIDIYQSI